MFDKLLLSTKDRRKGRTRKFLFATSLFYALALASALMVSVVAANPQLYESGDVLGALSAIPLATSPPLGTQPKDQGTKLESSAPPDIYKVKSLETMAQNELTNQPSACPSRPPSVNNVGGDFIPGGSGNGPGIPGGDGTGNGDIKLPTGDKEIGQPPPPVTKPVEKPQPPVEKQLVRLPSTVLTGNALERRTPTYPVLAKQIRLEGSIVVEVFISPDGRVESARALGGHPLLTSAAVEAARGWRFQPTLLNGVAVRVTGVITFNFKLN